MKVDQRRAFPSPNEFDRGMSLREYAAIQILTAWCSGSDSSGKLRKVTIRYAVQAADSLVEELNATVPEVEMRPK